MAATEIASAYLSLYAKMPGVQNDIAGQLGAVDVDKVGQDLGKKTGAGYTKGFAVASLRPSLGVPQQRSVTSLGML
jgi:hypothetical protein